MLHQTSLNRTATLSDPLVPRVVRRLTPSTLEANLIRIKELKKRTRYYGSHYQHFNDRNFVYINRGGPKGTRFIVEKSHSRCQFVHPGRPYNRYAIRSVKTRGAQHDMIGNFTMSTWDGLTLSTNPTYERRWMTQMHKNEAIKMVEEWGVNYVLLDEVRKPSVSDALYHRHSIYAKKFYWTPDPETNSQVGDADHRWRGNECIPYNDYGSRDKDPRNRFRSLWKAETPKTAMVAAAKPTVQAAAAQTETR